ncbi:DUF1415 domain-containing protein [Colwellia hornerae]|uniref:DUF1415 domain-containing protein n=1 Tax=Colwellia hornerae TaxID=89402 RepID=A0A5C6Q7W3_9GAMM|nr:DUF1415 domain-containing protein [Colwellia hornerae]TWX57753.1 DUF1415 domain-containing protein [Colwellia hornerae]TWX62516.1 DUF1415 domain-containing protein [Colwellia hornerae]TWX65075.1 DUF1415 domain-containing protein [Colwellia hornerae]
MPDKQNFELKMISQKIYPVEILQTKQWLEEIIIGLNFCPFAKKEFVNNTIHYQLCSETKIASALAVLTKQFEKLVAEPNIETTLLIFNEGFKGFESYLDLLDEANELLFTLGYEGVFQLASFHPDYYFEGEPFNAASNYTNRSPLPTLHLIREASMEKVLSVYKDPQKIPDNNIALAQEKGAHYFQNILKRIAKLHQ